MKDRKENLKDLSDNLENILGKEVFENIKKAAKDSKLNSSSYYSLAEKFKLLSNFCVTLAKLLDIINQAS